MTQRNIDRLLEIMARLRDPEGGCPWDLQQSFATIAPYTIEEAYEVADAISREDMADLRDELGLLQVVFHARMAEEAGAFNFDEVAQAIADKMIRRHPHVFGDERVRTAADQSVAWENHKAAERLSQATEKGTASRSALDGVAIALPALTRALKLQARAARVGFDWPEIAPIFDKIKEEIGELSEALAANATKDRVADELGDILFAMVNLVRRLEFDPEAVLRQANGKFERRFRRVEALLAERGRTPADSTLAEMDALWEEAKREEKTS